MQTTGVVEDDGLNRETNHTRLIADEVVVGHVPGMMDRLKDYIHHVMQSRRYQDPRDHDPDYGRRLRELEGQIAEIDREQQGFRMGDYHEGGGDKWQKWAMPGLVTLAVSGIIANIVQAMTVSALKQEVADLRQEVNDVKKLVEPRFRGG